MTEPAGRSALIGQRCGAFLVTAASASIIGGRDANADAARIEANPLGVGMAVVDGIGTSPAVIAAARIAADAAGMAASHRGALAGILTAADTMPNYPGAPNAVAAVASIDPFGRIELAHVGDVAAWTWSRAAGLKRWTVDHTAGEHVAYVLTNSSLASADREALQGHGRRVVAALDDYVLNTLARASVSTVSFTPLRGEGADVDLIVLTSDGVHKVLPDGEIAAVAQRHALNAQALADALVEAAVSAAGGSDDPADNATAAVIALARS